VHTDIVTELEESIKLKDQIILLLLRKLNEFMPFEYEPLPEEGISLDYQKLVDTRSCSYLLCELWALRSLYCCLT